MKNFFIVLIVSIIVAGIFITLYKYYKNEPIKEQPKTEIKTVIPKLKVIFIVSNPNIDFNKMAIDEITDVIQEDSLLQINSITPEFKFNPQIIKVYKIEDITCPYLKTRFKDRQPGELVYEYNGKILVKLNDGIIKIYHNHINEIK